jgi:hypothetical protein
MRWRDIRFEKPTKEDGDEYGTVLQRLTDEIVVREPWDELTSVVAWMPLSELPQPDLPGPIPDGWRPVDKAVDAFRDDAKCWAGMSYGWSQTLNTHTRGYSADRDYIVPIDPPVPQYRPFANAAEFMPHADRWLKEKLQEDFRATVCAFNDKRFWMSGAMDSTTYADGFCMFEFADGSPFGVKVETNQ